MVNAAFRLALVAFGATEMATIPLPVPAAPLVIETQAAGDVAVHEQPAEAATVKFAVVPVPGADTLAGITV